MKKIYIITVMLILCLCKVCNAMPVDYLNGCAVNVIEGSDSIDIYARVCFAGTEKDKYVPKTSVTYSEAFIIGAKYVWSGVYNNKAVKVHIDPVEDTALCKKIRVVISPVKDMYCYSNAQKIPPVIWIYTGDGRVGIDHMYSYSDIIYVAGHEFGHAALGLADVYSDSNEYVQKYLDSVMNSWDNRHAEDADYYALLKYHTWQFTDLFVYSSDRELLKRYLQIQDEGRD